MTCVYLLFLSEALGDGHRSSLNLRCNVISGELHGIPLFTATLYGHIVGTAADSMSYPVVISIYSKPVATQGLILACNDGDGEGSSHRCRLDRRLFFANIRTDRRSGSCYAGHNLDCPTSQQALLTMEIIEVECARAQRSRSRKPNGPNSNFDKSAGIFMPVSRRPKRSQPQSGGER